MSLSTLEAYDLVRFAEAFDARLATAEELLAGRAGLEREKEWMTTALQLVRTERAPAAAVLEKVRDLPELEEVREEYAFTLQNVWVDTLEKLHAGITFCASSRAPVIEALFPHLKFPQLRRLSREALQEFATGYERRLKSSYVSRILARDDFSFVRPVLEKVASTWAQWQACFIPVQLPHEQAAPLRAELIALGKRLDLALRQARCLAEAALAPLPESFENSGLAAKPRKRAGRGLPLIESPAVESLEISPSPVEASEPPLFVPDSVEPSEAERAELAALADDPAAPTAPPVAPPVVPPAEALAPRETSAPEPDPAPPSPPEPPPATLAAEPTPAPKNGVKRGRKKAEAKDSSTESPGKARASDHR